MERQHPFTRGVKPDRAATSRADSERAKRVEEAVEGLSHQTLSGFIGRKLLGRHHFVFGLRLLPLRQTRIDFRLRLVFCVTIAGLKYAHQVFALAVNFGEVVVRQLAPPLFHLSVHLFPVSCQNIIHRSLLFALCYQFLAFALTSSKRFTISSLRCDAACLLASIASVKRSFCSSRA